MGAQLPALRRAVLVLLWCLRASAAEVVLVHRWESCFAEWPYLPEMCCGEDALPCFNNHFLKGECCRRGFAMMFAVSPVEPLPETGFLPPGRARGPHPSYTARQLAWEREMAGSSYRYEVQFDAPRKEKVAFRYFKVGPFDLPAMAEDIRRGEYGFQTHPLEPGDVVLDIGANAGLVSVPLAKLYPGVRVIAVEPDPTNFRYLLWNARANNVSSSIWPLNAGVFGGQEAGRGRNLTYSVPDLAHWGRTARSLQRCWTGAASRTFPASPWRIYSRSSSWTAWRS